MFCRYIAVFSYVFLTKSVKFIVAEQKADPKLKLRNYQVEISRNILNFRNDIILLPTGTGKTLVAINLIRKHLEKSGSLIKLLP